VDWAALAPQAPKLNDVESEGPHQLGPIMPMFARLIGFTVAGSYLIEQMSVAES
jgi:hypothetical protein